MISNIISKCSDRWESHSHSTRTCTSCTYNEYCPSNCGMCLNFIHRPRNAPLGAPERKYDCKHMADFYTCKYACRYTSEIIYALQRIVNSTNYQQCSTLKVLSFGCGPCTDLFAIDFMRLYNELHFNELEYVGIDYSEDVWKDIHYDIKTFETEEYEVEIEFVYENACEFIETITSEEWVPNLIVFQYVFSDMQKHTEAEKILEFIDAFAEYYNERVLKGACIILNDINLGIDYNGGREYFEILSDKLDDSSIKFGRFCDNNASSSYYPRGYTYGEHSEGEFPENDNLFDLSTLEELFNPFDTCASAQMIITKER